MDENYRFVRAELTLPNQPDKAGHCFPGVDGVQKNSFQTRVSSGDEYSLIVGIENSLVGIIA